MHLLSVQVSKQGGMYALARLEVIKQGGMYALARLQVSKQGGMFALARLQVSKHVWYVCTLPGCRCANRVVCMHLLGYWRVNMVERKYLARCTCSKQGGMYALARLQVSKQGGVYVLAEAARE